ncbi:MAG TPA: hypothetical protein VMZ25_01615 [Terriglobales bacterium]|nr:hypothetical protein [Terriglobales bacterium]
MSTIATRRSSTLPATPAPAHRPLTIAAPTAKRKPSAVERGDLLAVPLCILWGIGLWAWPIGLGYLPGTGHSANPLSFLWELPLTVARFLFGW